MFLFDEKLFNESLIKTRRAYAELISVYPKIQEIEGISESYDGSAFVLSACHELRDIDIILEGLMYDMLRTARMMGMDVDYTQQAIFSIIGLGTISKIKGYNLDAYGSEVFSFLFSSMNDDDMNKILRGLKLSKYDKNRIFSYMHNKKYEKLVLELLYFTEQEQYDELNDRYKYVSDRINDIENQLINEGLEKHEFFQELNAFKLFLEDNKDNPNIKDYKLLLDDREISFDSYEEGMSYINNIVGDLNKELKDLKEEKESLEGRIKNFDFQIGSVYDYDKGIDLVSENEEEFQKLLESINVLDSGFYKQVFKVDEYPSNYPINFFLETKNPIGGYGCDQGIFKMMDLDNQEYLRLKDKLVNEYGFSRVDATKCIQLVDCEGACFYATTINSLLEDMNADPEVRKEIEENSGIKLYNENGRLNTAEFLLDFFVQANTFQNGGELFYQEEDGSYHVYENIEISPPVNKAGNVSYISRGYRGNAGNTNILNTDDEEMITSFLQSLSPNLEYTSEGILNSGYDNPFKVEKKIMRLIDEGANLKGEIRALIHPIHLQKLTSDRPEIKFEGAFDDDGFKGDIYSGPHAISLVGYDYDGIIINTWGSFYKISWEDVASSSFHINDCKVTLKESD